MQPGPVFFKSPRKAGLFGVCSEELPRQVNYVIDEFVSLGNTTISLLHSFLEKHSLGETTVYLQRRRLCRTKIKITPFYSMAYYQRIS